MGGLVLVGIAALIYWLQSRRPAPVPPWQAQEQELERKGLRPGRDYTIFIREGRAPRIWINPEGRKRLQRNDRKKKKKNRFRVFDDV